MKEKLQQIQEALSRASKGDTQALYEIRMQLSDMLLHLQIRSMLDRVTDMIGDGNVAPESNTSNHDISRSESLENLEDIATTQKDGTGKRRFLLHRATDDHEYAESLSDIREYTTSENTVWVPVYTESEDNKDGANPVVTCWIPEDSVAEIPHPHINTGTWGEMGQNPHAKEYTVVVKPGKYELLQEYKGA